MNPETGEFHVIDEENRVELGGEKVEVPNDWPCFALGDEVQVNGWPFAISRINRGSIILRPIPLGAITDTSPSPRRLMDGYMYGQRR